MMLLSRLSCCDTLIAWFSDSFHSSWCLLYSWRLVSRYFFTIYRVYLGYSTHQWSCSMLPSENSLQFFSNASTSTGTLSGPVVPSLGLNSFWQYALHLSTIFKSPTNTLFLISVRLWLMNVFRIMFPFFRHPQYFLLSFGGVRVCIQAIVGPCFDDSYVLFCVLLCCFILWSIVLFVIIRVKGSLGQFLCCNAFLNILIPPPVSFPCFILTGSVEAGTETNTI